MKLNLVSEADLTRPETDNIKLRLSRVEAKEISTVTLGAIANSLMSAKGDLIVASAASTPARYGVVAPAAGLLNVLGVANAEDTPTYKTIFDTTAASAVSLAAGTAGTQLVAARRDHTHLVTASSAGAADAHIVATDASGYTQVIKLGVGVAPSSIAQLNVKGGNVVAQYSDAVNYAFFSGANAELLGNAYFDGAYKRHVTGKAAKFALNKDGQFTVATTDTSDSAGATITFTERFRVDANGVLKIAVPGPTYVRSTTQGTNHLEIFDGTAPVGNLTNGCSIFSEAGHLKALDHAGVGGHVPTSTATTEAAAAAAGAIDIIINGVTYKVLYK